MSGSGFTNDVMHAENVDFTGNFPVSPQVTTNGQLLIGSTAAPNIRVGTLTSGTGINIANGAGSISISSTAFTQVVQKIFTSSGTYTPTTGMKYCLIELVPGGGAGGGAPATSAQVSCGGGGSGGNYCRSLFDAATIGPSRVITVGAGGVGNSGSVGGAGGTSDVIVLMNCNGGLGGLVAGPGTTAQVARGGDTTVSGTAQIVCGGSPGGIALALFQPTFFWSFGGFGGSSYFGGGARAVGSTGNSFQGLAGSNYGSGGSGAINCSGGALSAVPGGNGAPGIIIITEYI